MTTVETFMVTLTSFDDTNWTAEFEDQDIHVEASTPRSAQQQVSYIMKSRGYRSVSQWKNFSTDEHWEYQRYFTNPNQNIIRLRDKEVPVIPLPVVHTLQEAEDAALKSMYELRDTLVNTLARVVVDIAQAEARRNSHES